MKMISLLLSIYFWSCSVLALLVTFVICILSYPFISQKSFARLYECLTAYTVLYCMTVPGFWKLKITDNRKDKRWTEFDDEDFEFKDKQYIITANHMSFIDSLITVTLPVCKKFMIGKIFTKAPVFGWLTMTSGFVPAERGNEELNRLAVDRAVKSMEDGSSFQIFPEGMRQKIPYSFEKFKTGAYRIAYITEKPILPITLKGTEKAMPIGGWVYPANIEIIIDEPFNVDNENYDSYINKNKEIIENNL